MQKLPLILAIIFAIIAAGLGFTAKQHIDTAKNSIATVVPEAKTQPIGQAAQSLVSHDQGVQAHLKKTTGTLHAAQAELTSTNKKLDDTTQSLASTKDSLQKSQAEAKTAADQLTAAQKQITDLKETIAKAANTPGGGSPDLAKSIAKLQTQVKDAQTKVAELTQVNKTLQAKATDAQEQTKSLQKAESQRKNHIEALGLHGTVLAVNPSWNFIVINIGDNNGVVSKAVMAVKRGGQLIGKVRISTVNPSTAVANVIPGTLARGVRIQPGDQVIYTGS